MLRSIWIFSLVAAFSIFNTFTYGSSDTLIMTSDQVKRGMIGIGKTVFQGTKIEEFEAEILGVMRNWRPKSDLILAKLSGGPLEETGLIAGMSGSPVYIDGKLIGAIAYGWLFSKEPVCGITPIAEMIEIFDRGLEERESLGIGLWEPQEKDLEVPVSGEIAFANPRLDGAVLKPLGTPLILSGFDRRVVDRISPELAEYGFIPVQGGSGSEEDYGETPFVPGAALGVQLIRGDLSATGIGTLTYRDGDRIVGFGHSMFYSGSTDLPMTGAYIHDVIKSRMWSLKLGSAAGLLGAIRQDRRPAIAGLLGEPPDMIPVTVEIGSDEEKERYDFEVLRHRDLGPFFTGYALSNIILTAEKMLGEATVKVKSRIEIKGYPVLERENIYSGSSALFQTTGNLVSPIYALVQNEFKRVRIERVEFEIAVEERARVAFIEEIQVQKTTLKPGEEVEVRVFLRPYMGKKFERKSSIKIPEGTPDGPLILHVGDSRSAQMLEVSRAPGKYVPRDVSHLLSVLEYEEKNNDLIVELFSPERGLTIGGRELPSLPISVFSILRPSKRVGEIGPVSAGVLARERLRTDFVLSGSQTVRLTVDRNAR